MIWSRATYVGCDSRAPRRAAARNNPGEWLLLCTVGHAHIVATYAHSVLIPAFLIGAGRPRGKGRKRCAAPEWDEDEEWPVEAILDKRLATKADKNAKVGDVMYLVAWEGWDPSYNSWEPEQNVADDLIEDYELRADAAEDEAESEEAELAEEAAIEQAAAHCAAGVSTEQAEPQPPPAEDDCTEAEEVRSAGNNAHDLNL